MKEKQFTLDDVHISLSDSERYKGTIDPKELMKKSVITNGFVTRNKLPFDMYNNKNKKPQKIKRKLSEATRKDIQIIRMRAVLDPKRFYKRNLIRGTMENVKVGNVLDSPADFYYSRLPNKSRKNTLVDELLSDTKFKKDIKRRYLEIIEQKKFKYKKEYKHHKKIQRQRSCK